MKFYRLYPNTLPPMKAEKSALGSLPTAGFQYCEPVRTASSYGWLVFPPKDIHLRFDGQEVLTFCEDGWRRLEHLYFEEEFWDQWDQKVPENMKGVRIPYLSTTFFPGLVQVWSGLLVETKDGQSTHVRPLANVFNNSSFVTYEGIVRTDLHKPWPLFGNIRIIQTDREIALSRHVPIFQAQPVDNECLVVEDADCVDLLFGDELINENVFSEAFWRGLGGTVRDADVTKERRIGDYSARVRRDAKHN